MLILDSLLRLKMFEMISIVDHIGQCFEISLDKTR